MYSKAMIARPIRPLLVVFPTAFYAATVVALLIAFHGTGDGLWRQVAFVVLSILGLLATYAAATLGWKLVPRHHVGVQPFPSTDVSHAQGAESPDPNAGVSPGGYHQTS